MKSKPEPIPECDRLELEQFRQYLDDAKKLSEPELMAKYAEYLFLSPDEVKAFWRKGHKQ